MCNPLLVRIWADADLTPTGPIDGATPDRYRAYVGNRWFTPRTGLVVPALGWTPLDICETDWQASEWEPLHDVQTMTEKQLARLTEWVETLDIG